MATNSGDIETPHDEEVDEEQPTAGNWLGRWVLMLAIVAFLIVYVAQLWRGTGMMFTILISTAAMGVVGAGGMAVRQMLLRTASRDRAAGILDQMQQMSANGQDETDAGEGT